MQGDEARTASQGGTDQTRSGPRHAAPRKSLLTRVHMPAGKAIALAAMPTAVLMGMGMTPRLAQADELPKNPFKGSSCVTQSDTPAPQQSKTAAPAPSATATAAAPRTTTAAPQGAATKKPAAAPQTAGSSGGGSTPAAGPTAQPSPAATPTTNPLDPLGLGNLVGGLVGTLTGAGSATATPAPSATRTAAPAPAAAPTTASSGTGNGSGSAGGGTGSVGSVVQHTVGAVAGTAAKTLPAATATPAPSASATAGQGYPCPTYNAQALADATLEQTPELLPNQPWVLKTDLLTLTGLNYHGVVKVRLWDGTVKDVLKFTATGVDIRNLHQITQGPDGVQFNVQARSGSTSTIRNGTVTMYTEELKGNLFGLIPVTFTPSSPPPLNVPAAFFTNVTVTQAGQFGGTLTVPGMHVYSG